MLGFLNIADGTLNRTQFTLGFFSIPFLFVAWAIGLAKSEGPASYVLIFVPLLLLYSLVVLIVKRRRDLGKKHHIIALLMMFSPLVFLTVFEFIKLFVKRGVEGGDYKEGTGISEENSVMFQKSDVETKMEKTTKISDNILDKRHRKMEALNKKRKKYYE